MSVNHRSIVINGDLGSGKTTISKLIAGRLGIERISIGDMYRQIAQQRGMSTLELNIHSELDKDIDAYIDRLQKEIASSGRQLVVDSRLAWLFFKDAFKVHLITDTRVAAHRVISRPADDVENYSSAAEAISSLKRRSESERTRFLKTYGADKERLRNYDLIVDTTRENAAETANQVVNAYERAARQDSLPPLGPYLLLDPARVYPSILINNLRGLWDTDADFVTSVGHAGLSRFEPITIAYTGSIFYTVDGHRRLSAALQNDFKLISGTLLAEREEEVIGGRTAAQFFESELELKKVYDWEAAHGIDLGLPPHLEDKARKLG